ncbi:hypothetical protein [Tropicibacter naphthalenivorans]|uniref:Uncharacterized protein n=1 Tax=Tropicibacter naphthalenivorans TaxID=441103 RepID=A0A0P1GWW5_9RHOB|nr:hypothetical protein [Tropicibacter naphthalenivorans]CUH81398.1 hypothetical protein TRN7648_03448 [Tropicibacter naphthalenivorans]SMD00584.1 hypothetical protein SAMN04488093_109142 [Tropicibacter naphthalenivorans]
MRKSYGATVWNALREYGVWHPGSDIQLGDFGHIADGCFVREGNICEVLDAKLGETRSSKWDDVFLTSQHGFEVKGEGAAPADGSFEIGFGQKAGVVLAAATVKTKSIVDLDDLNDYIARFSNWKSTFRIVTTVRRCKSYAVFATSKRGGALCFSAPSPILNRFHLGDAGVSGQITINGATGLNLRGSNGAVSVQLHRRARWGSTLKQLETGAQEEPIDRLVPEISPVEPE